jgi:hypothetical protein
MDIDMIGVLGFVVALAAVVALIVERRMDVLYGPYVQQHEAEYSDSCMTELPSHSSPIT